MPRAPERPVVLEGRSFTFEPLGSEDDWCVWSQGKKLAEIVWHGELHVDISITSDEEIVRLVRACETARIPVRLPKRKGG